MTAPASLLVVGSGIAGLYAAVVAAERGHEVRLLTKDLLADSNTWYAQGGLSAVGPGGAAAGDTVDAHVEDTLRAGARLNDPRAVRALCGGAWAHVERLAALGAAFDADGRLPDRSPAFLLGLEGAHTHPRILRAGGDATGRAIARSLIAACRRLESEGRLAIDEESFVESLVLDAGRVTGARVLAGSRAPHARRTVGADAVLLATGGIGRLYPSTTNPAGATGDGAALAWEAGAVIADAEFVQFHPTLVPEGPFMVSEAVRGEGAVLLDGHGVRFMPAVHPDAELAPRDVVARAIHRARAETGAVYLDATAVERSRGAGFLARRFPAITARLAELGHDLAARPVPVAEAAHYWMGGVAADAFGRTTVPGLLAAGETACTGVHGANRLASNSLLEGLVYGWAAVQGLSAGTGSGTGSGTVPPGDEEAGEAGGPTAAHGLASVTGLDTAPGEQPADLAALHGVTGSALAVEREAGQLEVAAKQLAQWGAPPVGRAGHELANLLTLGRVVAAAALARTDSLGAHHRTDFPLPPAPWASPAHDHIPARPRFARRGLVKTGS
ncbi:L-aspartate oxidase [Arthrobacter halodurans]|uniref:L-aspartate oxidase n=1 Tax=Arthrobacter halodurans TaxID=516699 RepID=A0ABV4UIU2_9MICC